MYHIALLFILQIYLVTSRVQPTGPLSHLCNTALKVQYHIGLFFLYSSYTLLVQVQYSNTVLITPFQHISVLLPSSSCSEHNFVSDIVFPLPQKSSVTSLKIPKATSRSTPPSLKNPLQSLNMQIFLISKHISTGLQMSPASDLCACEVSSFHITLSAWLAPNKLWCHRIILLLHTP